MIKFKNIWNKFKSLKHKELIIAAVVGLILCAGYFAFFKSPAADKTQQNSSEEYSSSEEYTQSLENKLKNVISKISGVGEANVIITLESGFTYEYATDTETKTITSGGTETTLTTQTVILVNGQPVVVKQIYPVVKGVVIVAKGAENFAVKMKIISACETVLKTPSEKITVLY